MGILPDMPEKPPPDDQLADLFRQLPDARTRTGAHATRPAVAEPDLSDLYEDGSRRRDPKRRRRGGWVILVIVLLLAGGAVAGGWYLWSTYEHQIRGVLGWEQPRDYEPGEATGEAMVTISSGDTGSEISQSLFDAGVTRTPDGFYRYLIDTDQNPPFEPGLFRLQQRMTSEAALAAILDPANRLENTVLLREGLTVAQSLPILAETLSIPLADFEAAAADPSAYGVAAPSLEGWLFPATYTFEPEDTAADVIQTLVDRAVESLDAAGVPAADRQRILTIGSIIQREARQHEDFYKVSRVIQNRLDIDMLLQMDSTSQYGAGQLGDGSVSTSEEAQHADNAWNTYVHTGLPAGPIANPGDDAIDAAMHPADGPWIYFVTVDQVTGETIFSQTYEEHQRGVEQFRQWCSDHPGYDGC